MRPRSAADDEVERLVDQAATGDESAWRTLWTALEPRLTALVRRPGFIGPLGRREDAARDLVVAIMARLRDDGFRRLQQYLAARRDNPELGFMRWMSVVAKRVAIDCLRADPDYVDRRRSAAAGESPGVWIRTETLRDSFGPGARPPMTNRVTAGQILRYAAGVLSPEQQRALELWTDDGSYGDIARALSLDGADDAERLVHAALERLRRHFREGRRP